MIRTQPPTHATQLSAVRLGSTSKVPSQAYSEGCREAEPQPTACSPREGVWDTLPRRRESHRSRHIALLSSGPDDPWGQAQMAGVPPVLSVLD